MPTVKKFPPSPEIKRVISAARAAGISIGIVEIEPGRVRIHPRSLSGSEPAPSAYDIWKASQGELPK